MISQDSRSLKVLLVDDHHIVREGLRMLGSGIWIKR